jgi:hypothetical protein
MTLTGNTTSFLLEYITSQSFSEPNRLLVTILMKNIVKKVYGVSSQSPYNF